MATLSDVIRRILISAKAEGVDQTAASLNKLAGAQGNVAIASTKTEKSLLSVQGKLANLKRSVDEEYRSELQLAKAEKIVNEARAEGLIGITEQNRLLGLASDKFKATGESAKLMGERMETAKDLARGLVTGLGAGLALAGLAEIPGKIKEAVEAAAGTANTADILGTTTTELQKLQYAAKLTDVSTDSLNEALTRFSINLGKAQMGSGALSKILKENGVVISGDLLTDLERYSNLIQGATSSEQKNLLTTAAFGKGASELGRMVGGGADHLRDLTDEATKAGAVLSDETLQGAREVNDEFVKLQAQLDVSFEGFMLNIAPELLTVLGAITGAVQLANAAISAGKWAVEQALPIADRSSEHIEQELSQQQAILNRTAGGNHYSVDASGRITNADPMRSSMSDSGRAAASATVAADEAELAHRRAAAVSGFADTNGGSGWGTLPGATKTPPPPGQAGAKAANQYRELIAGAQGETDALNAQSAALGKTTVEATALEQQSKLLAQANKDGIKLSPDQVAAIDAQAQAYAEAKAQLEQLTAIYDTGKQATEDFFSTFKSDLENGTNLWQSFGDAASRVLDDIADKALQMAADGIWDNIFGALSGGGSTSGGGGILSSILGAFAGGGGAGLPAMYASGTDFAPGGLAMVGERGPEIVSLPRGAQVTSAGQSMAMLTAANGNGGGTVIHYHIDARGGELGVETKIVNALDAYDRHKLPSSVARINRAPTRRG